MTHNHGFCPACEDLRKELVQARDAMTTWEAAARADKEAIDHLQFNWKEMCKAADFWKAKSDNAVKILLAKADEFEETGTWKSGPILLRAMTAEIRK